MPEHTEGLGGQGDDEYLAAGPRWEYHCVASANGFEGCGFAPFYRWP
jgi:hypothetical protein